MRVCLYRCKWNDNRVFVTIDFVLYGDPFPLSLLFAYMIRDSAGASSAHRFANAEIASQHSDRCSTVFSNLSAIGPPACRRGPIRKPRPCSEPIHRKRTVRALPNFYLLSLRHRVRAEKADEVGGSVGRRQRPSESEVINVFGDGVRQWENTDAGISINGLLIPPGCETLSEICSFMWESC